MKQILFVIPAFSIGGTNTSLMSLLPYIDRSRFDVYVYALNPTGPMGAEIAKYSTVLNSLHLRAGLATQPKNFKALLKYALKMVKRLIGKFGIDLTSIYYNRQVKSLSSRQFDCVIAFQEGEATRFAQFFKNTRKAAWVRADYARYLSITGSKPELKLYNKYDVIVNVSESALNSFVKVMPELREKSIFIYNLVNKNRIISMSKQQGEDQQTTNSVFTIISLGRIDRVKHFTEIPDICKTLDEHEIVFKWLIIGGPTVRYPDEFKKLRNKITENCLEDKVLMLGHLSNPYPILSKGDLLVCLSESETFNHTFAEARTLGLPVLSVDYPGAEEMLGRGKGGIISERDRMGEMIEHLVANKELYHSLKQQALNYSFDNDSQLKKIYNQVFTCVY